MKIKDLFYDFFLKEKSEDEDFLKFSDEYKKYIDYNYNNFEVISTDEFFQKIFGNYLYNISLKSTINKKADMCKDMLNIDVDDSNENISFNKMFKYIKYILMKYELYSSDKRNLIIELRKIIDSYLEEIINLFLQAKDYESNAFSVKYILNNLYEISSTKNDLDIDRTVLKIINNDLNLIGEIPSISPIDSGDSRSDKNKSIEKIDMFFKTCMDTVNNFIKENSELEIDLCHNNLDNIESYSKIYDLMIYQKKFIKSVFIVFIAIYTYTVLNITFYFK